MGNTIFVVPIRTHSAPNIWTNNNMNIFPGKSIHTVAILHTDDIEYGIRYARYIHTYKQYKIHNKWNLWDKLLGTHKNPSRPIGMKYIIWSGSNINTTGTQISLIADNIFNNILNGNIRFYWCRYFLMWSDTFSLCL